MVATQLIRMINVELSRSSACPVSTASPSDFILGVPDSGPARLELFKHNHSRDRVACIRIQCSEGGEEAVDGGAGFPLVQCGCVTAVGNLNKLQIRLALAHARHATGRENI